MLSASCDPSFQTRFGSEVVGSGLDHRVAHAATILLGVANPVLVPLLNLVLGCHQRRRRLAATVPFHVTDAVLVSLLNLVLVCQQRRRRLTATVAEPVPVSELVPPLDHGRTARR